MPIESDKYIDFKNGSYLCVGRGNGKSLRQMKTLLDWISEHPDGKIIMPRKIGYTYSMKEAARILSDIPHVKKSHEDFIDALFYGIQDNIFDLIRKGEQKMGTIHTECCGGAAVNGALYYKDDDGNFVKLMTVTNIEETTTYDSLESEIKVDGYSPIKAEKVEVNNTDRRILNSISEKWSSEDHVYFMIFDGTDLSVKINRAFVGKIPDYSNPYRVTVYNAGHILWTRTYTTWRNLECTFLYEIGEALNASFSPISIKGGMPRMLKNAEKTVSYNIRLEEPPVLDAQMFKTVLNQMYGKAMMDNTHSAVAANIDKVIFDDPATVILWKDGTRTVVHAQDDEPYDKEKGFAMAVCKKIFGNERDYYHVFKRWFRKGEDRSFKRLVDKLGNNGSKETEI